MLRFDREKLVAAIDQWGKSQECKLLVILVIVFVCTLIAAAALS